MKMMLDTGYSMLDAGWKIKDAGYRLPVTDYRLLDEGMLKFLYPASSIYFNNTLKFLYN